MGECTAPPRSVQPSVPRWRPHSPRCSAQAASWPKQSSKQQEARSKKREARSKKRAASSEQRTDRSCRLPVPAHNSNYLENGRYYHGYRRGIYQYPCDEVSSFSLPCRNKTEQNKTKQNKTTRADAQCSQRRTAWTSTTSCSPWRGETCCTRPPCHNTEKLAFSIWAQAPASGR